MEKKRLCEIGVFENFLLRAPLFPLNCYFHVVADGADYFGKLNKIARDKVFQEAVLAASEPMFSSIEKWISSPFSDPKKNEKILFTIFKYVTRMCSQPTPFGLFAGCSLGVFGSESRILLNIVSSHYQSVRVDMGLLFKLWYEHLFTDELKRCLAYATNPESIIVGGKVHFIEKQFENGILNYNFSKIENTIYVQAVMKAATSGMPFKELTTLLTKDGIVLDEAEQFILDLINSHILICTWEPSLRQSNPLGSLIELMRQMDDSIFREHLPHANQIDKIQNLKIGTSIQERLNLWPAVVAENRIQTDLYLNCESCTLDKILVNELTECINFLCRLGISEESPFIRKFIDRFTERYDNREIPLLQVFDPDLGIFSQEYELAQDGLIIDNLAVTNDFKHKISSSESLINKLKGILTSNYDKEIHLEKLEISLIENLDHIPDTFSAAFHLFKSKKYRGQVFSIGHSSAVNLLSRFSFGSRETFLRKIADYEKQRNSDFILAGINHIPGNARAANVLIRPDVWEYEINFLSDNLLNPKTIPLSDLMISIDDESIVIKSRHYNKRVIPKISSAINVDKNATLIFKFLAYVESQGKATSMGLDWLVEKLPDLGSIPRISYKGIIILPRTWRIGVDDLKVFEKLGSEDLLKNLKAWRESLQLPEFFLLVNSNGENLLITLSNYFSAKLFLQMSLTQNKIIIQEFLFDQYGSLVEDINRNSYANQVILSLFKK